MEYRNESPLLNSRNNIPSTPPSIKPQVPRSGTFGSILNSMIPLNHEEHRSEKLRLAIEHNKINEVKRLIEAGVDVNKGNPLLHAAFYNRIDAIKMLLAAGANVDQRERKSSQVTPLYEAVYRASPEAVRILLDAGANIEFLGKGTYFTTDSRVSIENTRKVAQLLRDAGAKYTEVHLGDKIININSLLKETPYGGSRKNKKKNKNKKRKTRRV